MLRNAVTLYHHVVDEASPEQGTTLQAADDHRDPRAGDRTEPLAAQLDHFVGAGRRDAADAEVERAGILPATGWSSACGRRPGAGG